jgi:capsular exopolysaccharide synthesis family protein
MDEEPHRVPLPVSEPALAGVQYGTGGPGNGDSTQTFRRAWLAVRQHKWLVVGATLLGMIAGAAAYRFTKPLYVTQGALWIAVQQRGSPDRGPIQSQQLLGARGWVDLLKSYVVLDEAVRELRLFVAPGSPADTGLFTDFALQQQFQPGSYRLRVDAGGGQVVLVREPGDQIESAALGDSVGRSVGFAWVPPAELLRARTDVEFLVTHPRDAARQLGQALRLRSDPAGNFLRVELEGSNPVLIAATVNAVLNRFVSVAADLKREKLTELVRILQEQLQNAGSSLLSAETRLEQFRVRTITLPSERASPVSPGLQFTQDPAFRNFFDMRIEMEGIRRDREALQRAVVQAGESGVSTDAFEAIEAVQGSSELMLALRELTTKQADLRALRYVYTDEHPQVQRALGQVGILENQTVPSLARALGAELAARGRDLEDRIGSASNELQQIPARAIEEARLEREVAIADNLYTMLQGRYEEARLAERSSVPDVSILDPAVVPQQQLPTKAIRLVLVAVVLGFGMGVGGAVLLGHLDRRVRFPEQVTDQMGLPILGVIPHLKGLRNGRGARNTAPAVEALRGIRLNLLHSYGTAGPMVLTVTSPGSGDGKSFVSSNLALAFAEAGHRTLLIDADTRRGSMHRVLNTSRKPGLTDLLAARVEIARAVQKTEYPLLHFVGGGTRVAGAPELLGSPEMTQCLTALRGDYGVIIVDSPPLGAGVDAYALGTITGSVLIVLRTGRTDRGEAEAKLDMLDRLPVRVLGAVLNGAKDQRAYGYGYYSYYMPGYEHEDEVPAGALKSKLLEGTK